MDAREPFTFGIALIPRANAQNWPLVEALLDLTLASLGAQTDQDFRVVIAGHDRPRMSVNDPRVTFFEVDWPVQEPEVQNADGGCKKRAISEFVLERGGGLLMFLDADDWIGVRLVETARAMIGPDQIGALIDAGFVTDFQSLRAAPIPHPLVFDREFHRICGSSSVGRLRPDAADPVRRDPCKTLGSHHEWVEIAREHGAVLARLPVPANYLINTSENHSEVHGPYAEWRETFRTCVNRQGRRIDGAFAARFGLSVDQISAALNRCFPQRLGETTGRSPHPPGQSAGRRSGALGS